MILLPFFKRFAGIAQCAKQHFVEAFASRFAVEAFNEAILLELSRRYLMPIDTGFLNPFEDRHTGELGAVVRHDCLWYAAFGDDLIQFAATRWPDSDVSATSTKFSRLKSSTTTRMRNLRPSTARRRFTCKP
jgi:hypothetical protein